MYGFWYVLFLIDIRVLDGIVVIERIGRGFRLIFRIFDLFGVSRMFKFLVMWLGVVMWMKCFFGEVLMEWLFMGFLLMKMEVFDGVMLKNNCVGRGLSLRLSFFVFGIEKFMVMLLLFVKVVRV